MDRRTFSCAAAALVAVLPASAGAQATRPRRIGYLGNGSSSTGASQLGALQQGLRDLGWIDGGNLAIDYRWAEGRPERIPALVAEFVRMKVDVLVVSGPAALTAAKQATGTIPVVFVILVDPVPPGWVQSLARPGGNMTGLASQFEDLISKQLQILKEALPRLTRIAFLRHAQA
jgi:putative tryptophan/tyrosine transport system substrate-binding protein